MPLPANLNLIEGLAVSLSCASMVSQGQLSVAAAAEAVLLATRRTRF
jgi:hypothetical protein